MRGVEGWGRYLRDGSATAAQETFALTHPSNLREIARSTPSRDPLGRHNLGHRVELTLARLVHGPIAQECEEDPSQPARERHDGDAPAAPGGDAAGPLPQRRHGGEVRVGHDALVAQGLQAPRDLLTLRRGLDEDARGRPRAQLLCEASRLGGDPALDQLAPSARMQIWLSFLWTSMPI